MSLKINQNQLEDVVTKFLDLLQEGKLSLTVEQVEPGILHVKKDGNPVNLSKDDVDGIMMHLNSLILFSEYDFNTEESTQEESGTTPSTE